MQDCNHEDIALLFQFSYSHSLVEQLLKLKYTNEPNLILDKLKLTGRNLGRVFNFKCGHVHLYFAMTLRTKTAQLKVDNLTKTAFRFLPLTFVLPALSFFINLDCI